MTDDVGINDTTESVETTESIDTTELQETVEPVPVEVVVSFPDRSFLDTPFDEYSVTEGLLLLLFLAVFVAAVAGLLRRAFSWLR